MSSVRERLGERVFTLRALLPSSVLGVVPGAPFGAQRELRIKNRRINKDEQEIEK